MKTSISSVTGGRLADRDPAGREVDVRHGVRGEREQEQLGAGRDLEHVVRRAGEHLRHRRRAAGRRPTPSSPPARPKNVVLVRVGRLARGRPRPAAAQGRGLVAAGGMSKAQDRVVGRARRAAMPSAAARRPPPRRPGIERHDAARAPPRGRIREAVRPADGPDASGGAVWVRLTISTRTRGPRTDDAWTTVRSARAIRPRADDLPEVLVGDVESERLPRRRPPPRPSTSSGWSTSSRAKRHHRAARLQRAGHDPRDLDQLLDRRRRLRAVGDPGVAPRSTSISTIDGFVCGL